MSKYTLPDNELFTEAKKIFGPELRIPIEQIPKSDLIQLLSFEQEAKEIGSELLKKIPELQRSALQSLEQFKDTPTMISSSQRTLILDGYKRTIGRALTNAQAELGASLEQSKPILFTGKLTKGCIGILDGIISFKKEVDLISPGLSELAINAIGLALTAAITAVYPPGAFFVQVLTSVACEFLKTENLQAMKERFEEHYQQIQTDKTLSKYISIPQQNSSRQSGHNPLNRRDSVSHSERERDRSTTGHASQHKR